MRKIFVLGSSHTRALDLGYHQSPPPGLEMEFVYLNRLGPDRGNNTFHPEIRHRVEASGAALHVSLIGGNSHSVLSLLDHARRYDMVLPEEPDLAVDEAAEIVPVGLVIAELTSRIRGHLELLAAYRAAVPGRVVHVESPPPVPSEAHIRQYPGAFARLIGERGVTAASKRYKWWRLHSHIIRAHCAKIGVDFLPVPAGMQDASGMMHERGWNPDPTHGNALYGEAVIAQLRQVIDDDAV